VPVAPGGAASADASILEPAQIEAAAPARVALVPVLRERVQLAPVGTAASEVRVVERAGAPIRQFTARPVQPRAAAKAPVAASAEAPEGGSAVAGGAAALGAGSAGSGAGLWLALATLSLIALHFSRLMSSPAVLRPVPFISLLERPG
jgi:hypothetical protein